MAQIIPLAPRLAEKELKDAVERLAERARQVQVPEPEALGWRPVAHDEAGRPIRWMNLRYRAVIGYVPGSPELVYLDYRHEVRSFELSAGELAAGLESGVLPDPVAALDWRGEPLDPQGRDPDPQAG